MRYYIINKRVKSLFNSCRINQNSQKMNNIMKHEYNSTNEKKKKKKIEKYEYTYIHHHHRHRFIVVIVIKC